MPDRIHKMNKKSLTKAEGWKNCFAAGNRAPLVILAASAIIRRPEGGCG